MKLDDQTFGGPGGSDDFASTSAFGGPGGSAAGFYRDFEDDEESFDEASTLDSEYEGLVDIPMVPEMPEHLKRKGFYEQATYDDPTEALRLLLKNNPARRPVLLKILEQCLTPSTTPQIEVVVNEVQADNFSVYEPITLCRMLEKAGALELDQEQVQSDFPELVDQEQQVAYLSIDKRPEPTWHTTKSGQRVLEDERTGHALQELLEHETPYLTIYERVLRLCNDQPQQKADISAAIDDDPLVQEPRRFSNHFIEHLERCDALEWKNGAWTITELGKQTLRQLENRS